MKISEENLSTLRQRYTGETSDQVFNFIKRRIYFGTLTNRFTNTQWKILYIDDKQYWIQNNKKDLKYRLIRLIDGEFPNIDISVIHRTVKMFLDMVNLIDEDSVIFINTLIYILWNLKTFLRIKTTTTKKQSLDLCRSQL